MITGSDRSRVSGDIDSHRELNTYKYDIQIKEGLFILHFN